MESSNFFYHDLHKAFIIWKVISNIFYDNSTYSVTFIFLVNTGFATDK